ncbi:MAG TPA: T9SS type A sorting domain-containing protein [Saprospiraceae bacterium]|nr:T9SS type A sorting domain-containing protein [Saprospiraceae bacterium]
MKKPFLALVALFFCAQFHLLAQSQQEFLLDSIYTYNWDTTQADWAFQSKILYSYNAAGNEIETRNAVWNFTTNAWVNTGKTTQNGFDAYGNPHETIFFQWAAANNEWKPKGRFIHTFSDNGKLLGGINYNWSLSTNDWVQYFRDTTLFDGNWNQTEFIAYSWQTASNSWQESTRATYLHDENGHETEQINYSWTGNNWQPTYKTVKIYDTDVNVTEFINYSWDMMSSQWHQDNKATYTYDANGNQTENMQYSWSTSANAFVFFSKNIITYNGQNKPIEGTTFYWNADTQEWIAQYQTQSTYDENNNILENIFYNPGPNNDLIIARKQHFYWSLHTITGIDDLNVLHCSIYPNPAKSALQVQGLNRPTHASIYSVQGTLLQTAVLSDASSHLNIQKLPAGTYFLHLEAEGKTDMQRFIKQ